VCTTENYKLRACVVIPARFASSRFPGKPLVKLLGKSLVIWVAELSARAVGSDNVFIATDSEDIANEVTYEGFKTIMTSVDALTGTDRVAECVENLNYDIFVNVQGDEPLVDPNDINKAILLKMNNPNKIVNGYAYLNQNENPKNTNIPKVVTNESNSLLYISRAAIPLSKNITAKISYKKQVCIYAYSSSELTEFKGLGRKSDLELVEDIEILRFFEFRKEILMFECQSGSYAVDVPADVSVVEQELAKKVIV